MKKSFLFALLACSFLAACSSTDSDTDFDVYSQTDLAAIVSGKINTQTALALANDTAADMANATYDGISRALSENEENPIFNVYVGDDKVYSGYGKQQNRDSNMYGVKV